MKFTTIMRLLIATVAIASTVVRAGECTRGQLRQGSIAHGPTVLRACDVLSKVNDGTGYISDDDLMALCGNKACASVAAAARKQTLPNCEINGTALNDLISGFETMCEDGRPSYLTKVSSKSDAGAKAGAD